MVTKKTKIPALEEMITFFSVWNEWTQSNIIKRKCYGTVEVGILEGQKQGPGRRTACARAQGLRTV